VRNFILILIVLCISTPTLASTSGPWGISARGLGFNNLSSAVQFCSNNPDTLVIDKVINTNTLTLPKNCQLKVTKRGRIDVAAGHIFSYGGQVPDAGRYQIHGGSGTVANMGEARPEWFGSNTVPGTTDMANAIIAAASASRTVTFTRGVYAISKPLPLPTQFAWIGHGTVIRALSGWAPSVPTVAAATYSPVLSYAPMIYNPSAIDWWSMSGIELDGNGQPCYGLWLAEAYHGGVNNVLVTGTVHRPYTVIRGQQITHTDFTAYGCGDGVLTYDTTGLIFTGCGFERLAGSWSYDQRQPNSFSKGGVSLDNCWFESDATYYPTGGFLRLSGRRNQVKIHASFHTTATTELLFKLNDTADSLTTDGITMGAQACTGADIWVNDSSSTMGTVATAGSNGNKIRGAFVASKISDLGIGNSWDMTASLTPQVPHFTGRFQVRYGDTGSGIPITANSYVLDADYNAGSPVLRLLAAAASIDTDAGKLRVTSALGQENVATTGGFAWSGQSFTFNGVSGATGYQHPLYLGTYGLWVDSAGKLRIKSGTPLSDTDGTIIGTQS